MDKIGFKTTFVIFITWNIFNGYNLNTSSVEEKIWFITTRSPLKQKNLWNMLF